MQYKPGINSDYNIPMTQEVEKEVLRVGHVLDDLWDEAIEKGLEKRLKEDIKNLMKKFRLVAGAGDGRP